MCGLHNVRGLYPLAFTNMVSQKQGFPRRVVTDKSGTKQMMSEKTEKICCHGVRKRGS
jgi:hypothetical protein